MTPEARSTSSILQQATRCQRDGMLRKAEALYREAVSRDPGDPSAMHMLGLLLHSMARNTEALFWIRRSVELAPAVPEYRVNFGGVLSKTGESLQAIEVLKAAVAMRPNSFAAHSTLGSTMENAGLISDALIEYQAATVLRPNDENAVTNLTSALKALGRADVALMAWRQFINVRPDSSTGHSALLSFLHYVHGDDARLLLQEHMAWAARHAAPLPACSSDTLRRHSGRLRIGYLSPDLRDHPVSRFLEPILEHHDRNDFAIYVYSDVPAPDGITERLKRYADLWHDVRGLNDEILAQQIRDDEIDVLVDLAGHMPGGRPLVFARRAAPIQVHAIGYPATTGLAAMDFRVTDPGQDPPGRIDTCYTEKLLRVPQASWCYRSDIPYPAVVKRVARPGRIITFGVINRLEKASAVILRIWSQLLQVVPNSRLLVMVGGQFDDPGFRELFDRFSIPASRLVLVPRRPSRWEYLQVLSEIDICLDTFPYAGQTTTCDALFMGVPVVTLAGRTSVSRSAVGLMGALGLERLIATSPDEYVHIAAALARDADDLSQLHGNLRDSFTEFMARSQKRVTMHLENAFHGLATRSRVA